MRKQTKLVAVLSASALLAVGASVTSFAATGWSEENGTWVFYDKNGEKVTEEWKKSGEYWYWLNEDGEMAVDELIEDDDNYYYVNQNGAMVQNGWRSVENEDYDGDDEEEPENYWYYFGANGRAYKSSANSNNASFKTINGKKYIFDDEGKMLYGWINGDGERETGDDAWKFGEYYCGDENDGAQKVGEWAYLDITDDDYDNDAAGHSSKNVFDDEEQTRWFYFKTNGKKMTDEKGKNIGGRKYSFDEYGRMNAEWVYYQNTGAAATPTTATATQGKKDYTTGFRYYGDPESGARKTKGWFQVVPDENLHESKYDDDENAWYYSDKDGKLVASEIKTIDGKKYVFDGYGRMHTGLRAVMLESGSSTRIADDGVKGDDDIDGLHFDTEDAFKENVSDLYNAGWRLYYLGGSDDGAVKTGKQTVAIDGDSFTFLFNKSGSSKGQGKFGIDDDRYYAGGMLMAADRDDKYSVVKVVTDKASGKYEEIRLMTTEEFLDDEWISSLPAGGIPAGKEDDYEEYADFTNMTKDGKKVTVDHEEVIDGARKEVVYRVVNTAGTVQKSKSKAKDGDDRCYKINGSKQIEAVFVED